VRELTDRRAERGVLDGLVQAVRAGESRVLVVHGEAGVGKTALLQYLADRASGCRVLRVVGVQSEMELAFAGLHQLCAPLLDRLGVLPGPQQEALRTAFGMSAGPAPDRFLVGLAILGLLAEAAAERPVVCLADDAQWLDLASAQALAFVARRLEAESVGLVFSVRVAAGGLAMLPELQVKGLSERDARALLDAALTGPVDARVREQIVAETRGNPLALLELPRAATLAHLAGGFGLPGALPGRIEDSFRRRVDVLPAQTRRLLLLAAADPTGDPVLVWRAAGRLGISTLAAGPAAKAGLAEFDARVRFRHPLVRSAVYQSASARDRQEVHQALADARPVDCPGGPDRPAGPRRPVEPGDRRPAVPVPAYRPVSPGQGLHQARHHLPQRPPPHSGCPPGRRVVALTRPGGVAGPPLGRHWPTCAGHPGGFERGLASMTMRVWQRTTRTQVPVMRPRHALAAISPKSCCSVRVLTRPGPGPSSAGISLFRHLPTGSSTGVTASMAVTNRRLPEKAHS
jgi:AAA ATPase domain